MGGYIDCPTCKGEGYVKLDEPEDREPLIVATSVEIKPITLGLASPRVSDWQAALDMMGSRWVCARCGALVAQWVTLPAGSPYGSGIIDGRKLHDNLHSTVVVVPS